MADMSLVHFDSMPDSDEGFDQDDPPTLSIEDDLRLPPLQRVQMFAQSASIVERDKCSPTRHSVNREGSRAGTGGGGPSITGWGERGWTECGAATALATAPAAGMRRPRPSTARTVPRVRTQTTAGTKMCVALAVSYTESRLNKK
ncbi:unnamed protein product [Acanthoscelides obtectus]|uniref:Uncharacterized protein n=1 Tax=Acanthoscelides obtectus TaxID=200917 RepID=A0A9P0KG13_ACAOB|nr:unnamed protein product [Acanthoscelides obtectus]CAK1647659.1 hypothetical protein AOBTE_LOCUS15322 [Acanthoscelides obtectus]